MSQAAASQPVCISRTRNINRPPCRERRNAIAIKSCDVPKLCSLNLTLPAAVNSSRSIVPRFLNTLAYPLCVFFPVVLVEIRCFDVGWRGGVRIVQETTKLSLFQLSLVSKPYLWILVKTAATSYVGLHLFCRMSKHSSPVAYTFGWNI